MNWPYPAALAALLALGGCASSGAPTAPDPNTPAEIVSAWQRLNEIRASAGMPPVDFDADLSEGAQLHAQYLELNIQRPRFDPYQVHAQFFDYSPHYELPDHPGYTDEGNEAGQHSSLAYSGTASEAIEAFLSSYHHRLPMLTPSLTAVGMATLRGPKGVFHVLRFENDGDPITEPCFYPVPHQTGVPRVFQAGENPEPRPVEWFAQVPRGGALDTGFPITVDFGRLEVWGVTGSLETADGTPVEAHTVALSFGFHTTAAILPRPILEPDTEYRVRLQATIARVPRRYEWTFRTGR